MIDYWFVLALAFVVGFAKTSIGGMGALAVALFALVMPTRESTRDGVVYLGTGIDRVVAQATMPILIVAFPLMAAGGWLPVRLAVWPAAAVGAAFDLFAVAYPDHLASPGSGWGTAALVWSVSLVLVAETVFSPPHRSSEGRESGRMERGLSGHRRRGARHVRASRRLWAGRG